MQSHQLEGSLQKLLIQVQKELISILIEADQVVFHELEEWRGCIGCHQAAPVDLVPRSVVVDPDLFQVVLNAPFLFYGYGEGKHPVGTHDPASVPVGLFGIVLKLLQDDPLFPDQAGKVIERTVIECRIDQ